MSKPVIAVLTLMLLSLVAATVWVPTVPPGTQSAWLPTPAFLRFRPVWSLDGPIHLTLEQVEANSARFNQIDHEPFEEEHGGQSEAGMQMEVVNGKTTFLVAGRVHWPTLVTEVLLLIGVGGLLALLLHTRSKRRKTAA